MIGGFTVKDIADLGGWLVLALLLALGWLIPKRTVEREQKLLEDTAAGWKEAATTQAAQLDQILTAIRQLAESRERT